MRCDTAQPCCGSRDSAFRIRRSSVPWGRSSRGLDILPSSRAKREICFSACLVLLQYRAAAIVEGQDKRVKRSVARRRQPRLAGSEATRLHRELVRRVQRRNLVTLRQRRIVEDGRQEVVQPTPKPEHGLADVQQLGCPGSDDVHTEQSSIL